MSNALAIAAVTATLRHLLEEGIKPEGGGIPVTTKPPDKARDSNNLKDQLNLFLYHTMLNGAWRNMDMPRQVKAGETGQPPLALDLYYLLTAYSSNDDDTKSHRLLGRAMSVLHDHPLLGAQEIKDQFADSGLDEQVERVRVTPQPLSLEEISKLWTTFQTQYRISATYQVSVVLIESARPSKTPLPVLTRGQDDKGVVVQANLIPPFPTLEEIALPNQQPSAHLGDVLTLSGHHLDGTSVSVAVKHPRLPNAVTLTPEPGATATGIKVKVPIQPNNFAAGFYTLAAIITRPGEGFSRTTNELSFPLAPQITTALPLSVAQDANGDATLNLTCKPQVRPPQPAALLLGDREIPAQPHPTQTATLKFVVKKAKPGTYLVRLRVDGVDSLLVNHAVTPPAFFANQKVTITP